MLKRSIIQLSFLFALWSFAGQGSNLLFSCLTARDYECIFDEIELNQDWQQQTNKEGQTPLHFAIDEKDPDLVVYLIRRGARVENEHVGFALKQFFQVEPETMPPHQRTKIDSAEVKRLILAALNDVPTKQPKQLSIILSLISNKQKIVDALLDMHQNNLLTKREINIFLREYYHLFFRNNLSNKDSLFYVVNNFYELAVDKYLLLMMCRIHKESNKTRPESEIFKVKDQFGLGRIEEKLAYAIIEKTRKFFHEFQVEGFFDEVNYYKHDGYLVNNIASFEKLIKFIIATITFSNKQDVIDRNYRTWLNTYRIVVDNGDFNGAFFMTKALNAEEIRSVVSKDIYQNISLITADGKFKNYYDQMKLFKGRFHMPAIIVLKRKISQLSNLNIIDKKCNNELLNEEVLKSFIAVRSDISKHIKWARKRRYESLPAFHELFDNLCIDTKSKEFRRAYNLIWPRRKSGRSVSMRLDNNISIVVQNKGSRTPREQGTPQFVD